MHQIIANSDLGAIRWHKKIDGRYMVEQETGLLFKIEQNEWYHVKCLVNKGDFKISLGKIGEKDSEELPVVAEWTDPGSQFSRGYVGFREFSDSKTAQSECAQIDNITIRYL